jgi:osmotically-inducible protein OsmY
MRVHFPAAVIVLGAMLAFQTPAWGQTRTMFGSGTTMGGSLTSGTRTMAGGTGTSGGGSLGNVGTTGSSISSLSSGIGTITGSESFVRGNQRAGSFVGASSSEMGGVVGSVQAGQQTGSGLRTGSGLSGSGLSGSGLSGSGLSGSGLSSGGRGRTTGRTTTSRTSRTGMAGMGGVGGRRSTATEIRATLRVGFSLPVTATGPVQISNTLEQRLSRLPRVGALSPVEVLVQGQTATLRGVVSTDYDRALAAEIALLEPGVSQVQNELVVAAAPAEPAAAPSPAPPATPPPVTP